MALLRALMLMSPDDDKKGSGGASGGEGGDGGTGGQQGGGQSGDAGKKPEGEDKNKGAGGGAKGGATGAQQQPSTRQRDRDRGRDDEDDDDEPETGEDGMVKAMPLKAFMRRVSRMTNKQLRDIYGHSDVEKIIAERKELEELRGYKSKAEKEKLSERERLAKEKEEADARAKAAEERATQAEQRAAYREKNTELRDLMIEYVDRDDADDMLDKLARAITKHPKEFQSKKDIRTWVKEYISEHPKWAKGSGDDKGKDGKGEKKPAKKVGIDNGSRTKKPDNVNGANGDGEEDIMKMSKKEMKEKYGFAFDGS